MAPSRQRLSVESLEALHAYEGEIIERLSTMLNGEQLFLLDPLRAMADVDVALGREVIAAITGDHPNLANRSPTPYDALKSVTVRQPVRIRLHGLFRKELS